MGVEGMPKQTHNSETSSADRQSVEWNTLYQKQLSYYGSPENRHAIEQEYSDELKEGEITFEEALKDYAARMTDATHKMKQRMKALERTKEELYGPSGSNEDH